MENLTPSDFEERPRSLQEQAELVFGVATSRRISIGDAEKLIADRDRRLHAEKLHQRVTQIVAEADAKFPSAKQAVPQPHATLSHTEMSPEDLRTWAQHVADFARARHEKRAARGFYFLPASRA